MLIVRFNNYHGAAFFTSANKATGDIYSMVNDVNMYFSLHSRNEELLEHNMKLQSEVTELRTQLEDARSNDSLYQNKITRTSGYIFNTANVVNNSLNAINNYIVLDKGSSHGVTPEMGVFNSNGVIGIIYLTSERYSLVIPLLNNKSSISCRIRGSNGFSTLQWDGNDIQHSYLVDLPRHIIFQKGDTVETSGFSSIFPRGIQIGTIDKIEDTADGMFYRAKVKLSVDFTSLTSVFIVGNDGQKEQEELEKTIQAQ